MAHHSSLRRLIVPIAYGTVSLLAASAQNRFSQAPVYSLGGMVLSAITTDFNHDGRTDMLALVAPVTGGTSSAITVTLATSTGAYTTPKVFSTLPANTTGFVGAGDFNHDGNVDFAAALSTGIVQIFLGNGDGTFQAPKSISFTGSAVGLLVGKFSGGSSSDLALFIATGGTGVVKLYASNGNGTFAAPKSTALTITPSSSVIGDVNRDGKLDLVFSDGGDSGDLYQVLLGNGDGTFRALASNVLGNLARGIAIADYNGDAVPDLIFAVEGDTIHYTGTGEMPSLRVLRGFGDGTFNNTSPIVDDAGNSGFGLTQGDFNNDGRADLVVYNGLSSTVSMKLMSPGGRLVFPAIASYAVWRNYREFVTLLNGDTDGDGKRDVLVVMKGGIQVLRGTSGGYLRAPAATDLRSYSLDLKSSDFNRDTFADLVIRGVDLGPKGTFLEETLYTAFGNGNTNQMLTTGPGIFSGPSDSNLGPLGIANFDQNGAVDLLTGQGVLFNNGNGTFSAPTSIPANIGTSARSIAVLSTVAGDLNGDGKADLVTVGETQLTVTLGNGDGTFKPEVNYSLGGTTGNAVLVRDINKDGKLDAVTANYGSSTVSVFLGKGDGTFQAAKQYTVTANPFDVAIGDFNGDGKLDIAAASTTKITILLGNGSGGFTTGTTFTAGTSLEGITAASLRGNGLADLMVVDYGESSMRLFYSNGNGTFASAVIYQLGSTPTSIVSGDFNGDGLPDAAVTLDRSTAIPVFLNQGGVQIEESAAGTNQGVETISATVRPSVPGNPTPTGTVTFREGSTVIATATLSGGIARFTTTSLSKGQHSVVGTYNGNSMYNRRTGPTLTFPVL